MKIKVKELSFDKVLLEKAYEHKKPKKPNIIFRTLMRILSNKDLKKTHFKYEEIGMEKIGKKDNMLILMNHSSFIDLEIASKILYPRPYNIICTDDGFVGKEGLMRNLGCIPTRKFTSDPTMVRDTLYASKNLHDSILLYPEASYTFDGTATKLPTYFGKFLKVLKLPVVMIKTDGAFLRDPLYNNLQVRKVDVSATVKYLLSKEDIENKSIEELNEIINKEFDFDNFKAQQENNIIISENFRADYLNRILYKCPHCEEEGRMEAKATTIKCLNCGCEYELSEDGYLNNLNGETKFNHIPTWYNWERECVKEEILAGIYEMDLNCDILVLKNFKCVYKIGTGRLIHNKDGFVLTSDDKLLEYHQSPLASYSLYSDYYWYELGDVICIGDEKMRYYCLPKQHDVVSKARLAVEELYKIINKNNK